MRKLIIPLAVLATVFLFLRLLFGYYVYAVPAFGVLLNALAWLSGVCFAAAGVLLLLQIAKEFLRVRHDKDKHDEN